MTTKKAEKATEPEPTPRVLMAVTPGSVTRCAVCHKIITTPMMGWVDDRPCCESCTADPRISTSIEIASLSLELHKSKDAASFWQGLGIIGAFLVIYACVLQGDQVEAAQVRKWLAGNVNGGEGEGGDEGE